MKYSNIQGFKVEEALAFLSTDRPPAAQPWPLSLGVTSSTCRSQTAAHFSAVRTPSEERRGFPDKIAPVSRNTLTWCLSVPLVSPLSHILVQHRGVTEGRQGHGEHSSSISVDMLKHSESRKAQILCGAHAQRQPAHCHPP